MPASRLFFNGVNANTGDYLVQPASPEDLFRFVDETPVDEDQIAELRARRSAGDAKLAPKFGVSPDLLDEAGWGVVWAPSVTDETKAALEPLLRHRSEQAAAYYYGDLRYQSNDTKRSFLARYSAGPGQVNPKKLPYYILLVGSPEEIPFSFQYQLGVQHAVGRLYFTDTDAYATYARSVVLAETTVSTKRGLKLFGPDNPDPNGERDRATSMSAQHLIEPLARSMGGDVVPPHESTKPALTRLLGGSEAPALLFTASHGIGFRSRDPLQVTKQGALLCQSWYRGVVPTADHYFAASDVHDDADVGGMITFHFACFSAGTPAEDGFQVRSNRSPVRLSAQPFLAALPQRLLSHQHGGALAVIGHVDRAWGSSFMVRGVGSHTEVFESSLEALLSGLPVGAALEYLSSWYTELSAELADLIDSVRRGRRPDHRLLAAMWTANNDARNYTIIGDPAVRYCGIPGGAK